MNQNKEVKAGGSAKEVEALDAIAQLTELERPRIAESVFVKNYLPLFASARDDVNLSLWLEVCGNAYLSVDVIKDGAVIFTVPSLIRRLPTTLKQSGRESLVELMDTVAKKTAINPNLGKNYLVRQIDSRITRLGVDVESLAAWNAIFTRYGYPEIAPLKQDDEQGQTKGEKEELFTSGFDAF